MASEPYIFAAHNTVDLFCALAAVSDLPEGTPVRILFRGATLDFPEGVDDRTLSRLANFAYHLEPSGYGVQ
jgi:hypothetical protein